MGRFIADGWPGWCPFIILVSITVFVLIKLPPGDFVSNYAASLAASGETVDDAMLAEMRPRYGLDQSWPVQYWHWISGVAQGDFGYSFKWQQPVSSLIGERMGLTLVLSFATLAVHLGDRAFPSASIPPSVATPGETISSPCSASLASPFRASCWRSR